MAGEKELHMRLGRLCLIALAYWASVEIGLACVIQPEGLASVWPASGVALGVLLLSPRRYWPETLTTLFAVNALANWMAGNSLAVCIGFAVANIAEPALGAWVLTRFFGTSITFRRLMDVIGLIAVATLPNALTSLLGAAGPALASGSSYWNVWYIWVMAHGLGIVLVTPFIVACVTGGKFRKPLPWFRIMEVGVLAIVLTGAVIVGTTGRFIVGVYVGFPLILWGALRFGLPGVTTVTAFLNGIILVNIVGDAGVFSALWKAASPRLLAAQAFLCVVNVTGLILAAIFSERRDAEQALRESEEKYRAIFDNAAVGINLKLPEGKFLEVNEALIGILGYSREELNTLSCLDITHPNDVQISREKHDALVRGDIDTYRIEKRYLGKNGLVIWIDTSVGALRDPLGRLRASVGIIADITERKRIEELLRIQRDLGLALGLAGDLHEALTLSLDAALEVGEVDGGGIYIVDLQTGDLDLAVHKGLPQGFAEAASHFAADSPQAMLISKREVIHRPFEELLNAICAKDDSLEIGRRAGLKALAVIPIRHQDRVIAALNMTSRTRDTHSSVTLNSLQAIASQIGGVLARIAADDALKKSQRNLHALFETMDDFLFVVDRSGKIVGSNPVVEKRLGYSAEELKGMDVLSVHPPERREDAASIIRDMLEGKTNLCSVPLMTKDKRLIPVETKVTLGTWNNEGAILGISRDITERLETELRMQQTKKAEGLGRMAGAIAHHYNNLLGVVMGNLELALIELPGESKALENIAEAIQASRRAADISHLMLAYLGHGTGERQSLDLSQLCREALQSMPSSLPKNVAIQTEFPAQGPTVRANAGQIKRVLTNLLMNAEEAIGEGEGDITVAITVLQGSGIRDFDVFPVGWKPKPGDYACLSVCDTGCGMDMECLEKAFDPFFSTKFTGRGLGLPVVMGMVKATEGAVAVESAPGQGTVFHVYLPVVAEKPVQRRTAEPVESRAVEERGPVLVVEDSPMLRRMAQTMLKMLGYDAITAADGVEAVEAFRQHQDEIRCVLCDLTMPRMGGWETLEALRRLRSDIPVILASGYDEAEVMAGEHPERPQVFLLKPYMSADLKAALDVVLCTKVPANA